MAPPTSKKPVSKTRPKPATKAKTKKISGKSSSMDSDTKTILSIVGGLGAILVIVLGGLGTYNYLSEVDSKSKSVVKIEADAPPSAQAEATATPAADLKAQAEAFKAFEGMRSTFSPENAYEPGEVIIAAPPANFEDKIRPAGFRVMEHVNLGRLGLKIVRVATPPGMSVPDALNKLAVLLPGVTMDANNQFEDSSGGMAQAGSNPRAMAGWDSLSPSCGKGLILGQIDSGVDVKHPALSGQKISYEAFTKSGRNPGPPDHGTAVAAMLVGNVEWGGLLPGATLYAANMFEINEQGKKVGSAIGLLKAVDWLATKKVHAVNLSIAGGDNKVVRKAFNLAQKANLLMIAAVGNWGRADKPAYPAAYDHVVAVTATKGVELIYSHANQGKYVDFAAPGVGIYTALAGGGGKPQTGTSFATPYITAMAAILNKAGKTPTATDFRRTLSKATRDLGKPGKDPVFGYGYVKARPACK